MAERVRRRARSVPASRLPLRDDRSRARPAGRSVPTMQRGSVSLLAHPGRPGRRPGPGSRLGLQPPGRRHRGSWTDGRREEGPRARAGRGRRRGVGHLNVDVRRGSSQGALPRSVRSTPGSETAAFARGAAIRILLNATHTTRWRPIPSIGMRRRAGPRAGSRSTSASPHGLSDTPHRAASSSPAPVREPTEVHESFHPVHERTRPGGRGRKCGEALSSRASEMGAQILQYVVGGRLGGERVGRHGDLGLLGWLVG